MQQIKRELLVWSGLSSEKMVILYISIVFGLSLAEAKLPLGVQAPWKSLEGVSLPDIPYPFKPALEEYKPKIDFDGCGGTINEPYVVTTTSYPFNSVAQSCVWKVETRKCFSPQFIVVSTKGLPADEITMEMKLGNNPYTSFATAKYLETFTSDDTTAEIRYVNNAAEQKGYGFQLLVDFIPSTSKECMDGFVYLSDMTCVASDRQGEGYVVQSPKHPMPVPAKFACKYIGGQDKLINYKVDLKGEFKTGDIFEISDLNDKKSYTIGPVSVSLSLLSPFFIRYIVNGSSPGFRVQLTPEATQPPAPCNTDIQVTDVRQDISNPFKAPGTTNCVIRFKPSDPAKKMRFSFDAYVVGKGDLSRLFSNYLSESTFNTITGVRAPVDISGDAVLLYRPGTGTQGAWKLGVQLI